jgi:hypothetical protein
LIASTLVGFLAHALSGTRNTSGREQGDGRGIFSFVKLRSFLQGDPSYFSKGCRLVELTSATPVKELSSYKQLWTY